MLSSLHLVIERRVQLAGALDFSDSLELRRTIGKAVADCPNGRVVLDLSEVTFVDSAIIGTMAYCEERATIAGVSLTVADASPRISEWLQLCGLTHLLASP